MTYHRPRLRPSQDDPAQAKPKSGRRIPQFDLSHNKPRAAGTLMLATRCTVAVYTARHENMVRKHCPPIACDVRTKALLFDMDDCAARLKRIPRRVAAIPDDA